MRLFPSANKVLLVGSSPDAQRVQDWDLSIFDAIIVINNAWQLNKQWHYHIYPEDFPQERQPAQLDSHQHAIIYSDYVPAQNQLGGFVYAGGTMAFTAAYWALWALQPQLLAFVGCDMVYSANQKTHFYGHGTADPLRDDITLQNLEAKAARVQVLAAAQACHCVNLSSLTQSRLVFPRVDLNEVRLFEAKDQQQLLEQFNQQKIQQAKRKETTLNYFVESGEYWKYIERFDAKELQQLDNLWLAACENQALD